VRGRGGVHSQFFEALGRFQRCEDPFKRHDRREVDLALDPVIEPEDYPVATDRASVDDIVQHAHSSGAAELRGLPPRAPDVAAEPDMAEPWVGFTVNESSTSASVPSVSLRRGPSSIDTGVLRDQNLRNPALRPCPRTLLPCQSDAGCAPRAVGREVPMSRHLSYVFILLAVVVGYPVAHVRPQAPPAARAADLVPVNVHVIDRNGKPVTDLKQSDFTMLEDSVPQRVQQFSQQTLAPGAPLPDAKPVLRTGISTSPQPHRIFVFALGLGRLEGASHGVSGLLRFVKTQLLPQDQVAIFAYDRALSFTSDHQRILDALERIKKSHDDVDFALGQQLGPMGMAPLYGNRVIQKKLQTKIDEMLLGPGAALPTLTAVDQIDPKAFGEMSLDTFMASSATSLQDLDNVMALMEYLRRFDGEKHVLFVTEQGFLWPSEENDEAVAASANDARVSIHTLQTGGQLAATSGKEMNSTVQQAQSFQSLRRISDLTGGISSIMESGPAMLDKLDEATRTGYLLEYRASNSAWDASYRSIVVKVNRPDVTVLHRHGYYRQTDPGPFDRRSYITHVRLAAAASFRDAVNDIKVKASVSLRGSDTMEVKGKIDLTKVKVATVDGARVGLLNIAVFGLDNAGNLMGLRTETLRLKMSEEEYARALKDGFQYTIQLPVIPNAQNLRFIVYDFGSDLVGRVDLRIG
jgi:VWFA-related protein